MAEFGGFKQTDFAAFEERKWSSNVYTLERMKVKDKLQAIAQHLAAQVPALQTEVTAHLSEEFPSIVNQKKVDAQWLYYCRAAQAMQELAKFLEKTELRPDKIFNLAPQEKHIVLALTLNHTRVLTGVLIHPGAWVDRRNLAAKLEHSWDRERLLQLVQALPEGVRIGFEQESLPAAEVTLQALEGITEQLRQDERRFAFWREWAAPDAEEQGPAMLAEIERTAAALAPILQFTMWSKANDHIAVGEKIRQEKAEQRKNATEFKQGDKVRVNAGLFAGRNGVVQAIDTKAQVKVQVGPLSVTVAATDLARL